MNICAQSINDKYFLITLVTFNSFFKLPSALSWVAVSFEFNMLMHDDWTYIRAEFYQYYFFYSSILLTFSEGWIQLINDLYTSWDFI